MHNSIKSRTLSTPYTQIPNWWITCGELTPRMMRVLFTLALHDGPLGCFPSVKKLSAELGMPTTKVYAAIRALSDARFLIRTTRGTQSLYILTYDESDRVTETVTDCDQNGHSGVTETVTPLLYTRSDIQDDLQQAQSADELGDTTMGEIKGPIQRTHGPEMTEKKPRREDNAEVLAYLAWFKRTYFASVENDYAFRAATKTLLREYGSFAAAKAATERAAACKDKLCKNGRKFTPSSVLYFMRHFDSNSVNALDDERKKSLQFALNLISRGYDNKEIKLERRREQTRQWIKVYRLSREDVSGIIPDDTELDLLFDKGSD